LKGVAVPEEKPRGLVFVVVFLLVALVAVAAATFVRAHPKAPKPGPVAEARALVEKGDRAGAARILLEASADAEARDELARLADVSETFPLADQAAILGAALEANAPVSSETVPRSILRARDEASKDPAGACELTARLLEHVPPVEDLAKARRLALEAMVQAKPESVDALAALAESDLDDGNYKAARERLEPVASKLGDGEGARVLGLALARTGSEEKAVPLLESFYKSHLEPFRHATESLDLAGTAAEKRALADLKAGNVLPSFQRRVNETVSPEERKKLLDGWVVEQVRKDRAVHAAYKVVRALAPRITAVALNLGGIEVQRAGSAVGVERRAHLEAAERYYLSIEAVAQSEDSWLIFLTQVRFALGRPKDAQRPLERVIARRERDPAVLLALATALHDAPSAGETVRALAEEAWHKLPDGERREKAAEIRATLGRTPKERVVWLERAGTGARTKTLLAQARAFVARDEGKFEDAVKLLDEVRAFYAEAGAADQVAYIELERFTITGDQGDLDRAIEGFDKAAAAKDAPVMTLELLADALLARAITSVVKDRVQLSVLHPSGPILDLVGFAATDEKDLGTLVAAFAANADRQRSVEVRERALAIDPSRVHGWEGLVADASGRRDAGALAALTDRIAKAPIDRAPEKLRILERWNEKSEPRRASADTVVALARAANDAPTLARALIARAECERDPAGGQGDPDLAVKLCEEAEKVAPRPYTRLALQDALVLRAFDRIRQRSKTLDERARSWGKLGALPLLALMARKDRGLATLLAEDEDVKRAWSLAPTEGEPRTFELQLARIAGGDADGVAKTLAASRLAIARARANVALSPEDPTVVLELVSVLEARGEADELKKLVDQAEKDAVLLPFDLLR
jgi:hypothetical protein